MYRNQIVFPLQTELAVNGNFEAGNVGFTSGYTYVNNAIPNRFVPEGTYLYSKTIIPISTMIISGVETILPIPAG